MSDIQNYIHPRPPIRGGSFIETTAGTTGEEGKVDINNIHEVYNWVVSQRGMSERFRAGMNSTISLYSTGWLRKRGNDNPTSLEHIEVEYYLYQEFLALGLCGKIVPTLNAELGLLEGNSIVVSQINSACPIWEYGKAVLLGKMSEELWIALCSQAGKNLKEFHALGYIHRDLHTGNVVVELLPTGEWNPVLIDFGMSSKVSSMPVDTAAWLQEDDRNSLYEDLDELYSKLYSKLKKLLEVEQKLNFVKNQKVWFYKGLEAFLEESKPL